MAKYWKVYISKRDEYTELEIARFTSKGLMMLCLPVIQQTYENTDYQVTFDHAVIK